MPKDTYGNYYWFPYAVIGGLITMLVAGSFGAFISSLPKTPLTYIIMITGIIVIAGTYLGINIWAMNKYPEYPGRS